MLEVVSLFVMAFITHLLDCYVFSKFLKEKIKFKFSLIIIIIMFCLIDCYAKLYLEPFSMAIITNLLVLFLFQIIFNKTITKSMLGTMFTYIGYVVSESLFVIIFLLGFKMKESFVFEDPLGIAFSNISILFIYFSFFNIKGIQNTIYKIMKWIDEKKFFSGVSIALLAMAICCLLLYQISYGRFGFDGIVVIFVILVAISVFIVGYYREKSGNNKLTIEYTQLLDYVKTYEEEVVDKSKKQHEYKNQLVIIDDMIPKTNKKAKEYLTKVLNKVEDVTDNDWLVKLKNLPSGGIKGLVHFKIKKMIENKISVYVDVDKKLSKKDNWINVDKNLEDISRILGVYLDNAIEASSRAKDKQIIIEFINSEHNIEVVLSNSYNGNINFDELDKEGYSTKGKNRGVGLSLVKDIIKNNKLLSQSREINGKFYVQKLYIKK